MYRSISSERGRTIVVTDTFVIKNMSAKNKQKRIGGDGNRFNIPDDIPDAMVLGEDSTEIS